ncbi:putative reverse transcriptase domain-containing protein [Tanacetum coccineum]|uniref:Reverse transcriptase domain-containing protein n=1 Tax=Tanacetum coccineum TaxID=301880 RepID=A0ABQ5J398_9ASTR
MPPKRTTIATTIAPMTNAAIKQLIAQGVADALVEIEANRTSRNGDDNHDSGTGSRRTERSARECTYSDFLKCQPLNFKTVGHDATYRMTWKTLKKMMTDKYCPRGKIKKLEIKLSNLKVKELDEDAIEFSTELMDKKIRSFADHQAENKRKLDDNSRNNQNQHQPFKRQNVARACTAGPGEKKVYGGSKPLCPRCNYHHNGQYDPKCTNCKRTGHLAWDSQGHFKRDSPKLKNNNCGNQARNGRAIARAYAVGNAGKNPDANVVTGMFLLNNRYASILFDTGADRSFVSTAFSSLIDIVPTALDHDYDVELADIKIIGVNTIIRGCTLNFLYHPFNIDLMPVEIGSFDVIIGMDWLSKYHAIIVLAGDGVIRITCEAVTIEDIRPAITMILMTGDYSKPSHEGYRNTIELPTGNNVVPLQSDTIRLVQNGFSFDGLWSEDPNQHLKDFLKLVDSLDLDGENRERTRLHLFQFSLCDQASNWLEGLPAGSITTWEDLTTRFLA